MGTWPLTRHVAIGIGAALAAFTVGASAAAQLRVDVAAEAVGKKRLLGDRPSGGKDAGIGGGAELAGHVALVPLVRVGAYVGAESSPQGDTAARRIYTYGIGARLAPPWPNGDLHAWIGLGLGYASVVAPSYETTPPPSITDPRVQVSPAGGGFFEVPLAIGAGYKLWRPLEIVGEIGGSLAFGASGSLYTARPFTDSQQRTNDFDPAGVDRGSVFVKLGVGVDL